MSSLGKALRILKALAEPPFEYSLTELSEHMSIGKSGLYKLLQELRGEHFVVQNKSTKKYHLGPISLRLGKVYSRYIGYEEIAGPILDHLLQAINETVYVAVWEGDRVVVVCKRTRPGALYEMNDFIGQSLPVNGGSSGRLLTAFQDPEVISEVLDKTDLQKRTPYTIADREGLLKDYENIRKQGYCVEDQTFSLGVMGISVPITDKSGSVSACLAMNASRNEENMQKVSVWIQLLQDAAQEFSYKLQFRH
jgi:DNA-binding IclR family transcriptional regulator